MHRSLMTTAATTMLLLFTAGDAHGQAAKKKGSGLPPTIRRVPDPSWSPARGARGHIYSPTLPSVPVAADYGDYSYLTQSAAARDEVGVRRLVDGGRAFLVPRGTPILVLEPHPGLGARGLADPVEVRILEGEHKDRRAWVSENWATLLVDVHIRPTPTQQAKAKADAARHRARMRAFEEAQKKAVEKLAEEAEPPK